MVKKKKKTLLDLLHMISRQSSAKNTNVMDKYAWALSKISL